MRAEKNAGTETAESNEKCSKPEYAAVKIGCITAKCTAKRIEAG
jgi:hypothetical protein